MGRLHTWDEVPRRLRVRNVLTVPQFQSLCRLTSKTTPSALSMSPGRGAKLDTVEVGNTAVFDASERQRTPYSIVVNDALKEYLEQRGERLGEDLVARLKEAKFEFINWPKR